MASQRTRVSTFDDPIASPAERRAAGKALRAKRPRSELGVYEPAADRRDPVDVIRQADDGRVPELLATRHQRMAVSPFSFLRGSALAMAYDLAALPDSGIDVQLCGDAHLSNFGVFNSPERRLVFDLNDFDETARGPFEWDVKRLAASIVVAGRDNGFDPIDCRRAAIDGVSAYTDWMQRYSGMTHLEVWYSRIDATELIEAAPSKRQAAKRLETVASKDHLKALAKLTTVVDGRRRIVDDPPLIVRFDAPELRSRLEATLGGYRMSLSAERRALFDHYRFVDFARKVVGVGSVGTRCWILALQGPNGGPLFLQLKEARAASPDVALGRKPPRHQGRRVVDGQRMLQATSDVMLGWATDDEVNIDYFVRQLWDGKGSTDVATLGPRGMGLYATFCGWALARAHARTGDSVRISGYIGTSDRFAEVMADWGEAYADQTERDHAAMLAAMADGRLVS